MSNYVKSTNFAAKDALLTGNPNKVVKGTEIDTEFNGIVSAVASKADINSPALTGVPTAPTAIQGTNTTQLATTAFVRTEINALDLGTMAYQDAISVAITGGTIAGITDLAVADGGTGASTFTANNVLLGNGSSSFQTVAPSTSGFLLTSNGTTWVSQTPQYTGTVTSITAGNGLTGGTITSSGTIALAAPTANSIGSYAFVRIQTSGIGATAYAFGGNYGTAALIGQPYIYLAGFSTGSGLWSESPGVLSGTWKYLGYSPNTAPADNFAIAVRVA